MTHGQLTLTQSHLRRINRGSKGLEDPATIWWELWEEPKKSLWEEVTAELGLE